MPHRSLQPYADLTELSTGRKGTRAGNRVGAGHRHRPGRKGGERRRPPIPRARGGLAGQRAGAGQKGQGVFLVGNYLCLALASLCAQTARLAVVRSIYVFKVEGIDTSRGAIRPGRDRRWRERAGDQRGAKLYISVDGELFLPACVCVEASAAMEERSKTEPALSLLHALLLKLSNIRCWRTWHVAGQPARIKRDRSRKGKMEEKTGPSLRPRPSKL